MIYNRKRQLIKSGIIITFILAFATVTTYFIYYKFEDKRNQISNSESLKVTFHEQTGDKVTLLKVTPVTDSVGLSSKAYTFTVKNNLNKPINYDIKIVKDNAKVLTDECGEYQIPFNVIKLGIHKNKENNKIYYLNTLNNNTILHVTIPPLEEEQYTVRFWISNNTLTTDSNLHFHGILQVVENGNDIATAIK